MDGSDGRSVGRNAGGIVSLAEFVDAHGEALEYDLIGAGYTLNDIGRRLPWRTLKAFINNLGVSSATVQELNPDYAGWGNTEKTNAILADIYDLLQVINANLVGIGSGKRPKTPKPYPRPWQKKPDEKKFGRGALPHDELVKFFERKRREMNERHD